MYLMETICVKMRSKAKPLLLIGLMFLLFLCVGYLLMAFYYRNSFPFNTWINGVYCTGKTVEEVNTELLAKTEAPIVVISYEDGGSVELDLSDCEYEADYKDALYRYLESRNPLLWLENISASGSHIIQPKGMVDELLLEDAFLNLQPVRDRLDRKKDYYLQHDNILGYSVYDGLSNRLDAEKAYSAFKSSIDAGIYTFDLSASEFYYDIELNEEQEEIKQLAAKLEAFQKCGLIYDMGDGRVTFSPAEMSYFIKAERGNPIYIFLDEAGNIALDESAVKEAVDRIADEYDTYGKEYEFQSTRGDTVMVPGGTYGTLIDRKAEVTFLMENLLLPQYHDGSEQIHIPAYELQGKVRGKKDLGNTYIEIDLTEQMMYYYEEGVLTLETPVVTGDVSEESETPEGMHVVYFMQRNRVLRGEGYTAPVKYWIAIYKRIGIHDSNWRKEFGGDIYMTNGSHGCINTPKDKVAELYELVEVGTPAVVFK